MKNFRKDCIGIFKYSSCNTSSIINALKMLRVKYILSEKFDEIKHLSKIILPGVGNMKNIPQPYLEKMKIDIEEYLNNGGMIYGICLGLQILFDESVESNNKALGIIKGNVLPVEKDFKIGLSVGFHKIELSENVKTNLLFSKLFKDVEKDERFYFLHKYYCKSMDQNADLLNIKINNRIMPVAFQKGNVIGTQFHPELSKKAGLKVLRNFIGI